MSESLLSGRFGEPEGGRLLSQKEKAALENLIRNEVILNQIIIDNQTGSGGTTLEDFARIDADGAIIVQTNRDEFTSEKLAVGTYAVDNATALDDDGGEPVGAAHVTPQSHVAIAPEVDVVNREWFVTTNPTDVGGSGVGGYDPVKGQVWATDIDFNTDETFPDRICVGSPFNDLPEFTISLPSAYPVLTRQSAYTLIIDTEYRVAIVQAEATAGNPETSLIYDMDSPASGPVYDTFATLGGPNTSIVLGFSSDHFVIQRNLDVHLYARDGDGLPTGSSLGTYSGALSLGAGVKNFHVGADGQFWGIEFGVSPANWSRNPVSGGLTAVSHDVGADGINDRLHAVRTSDDSIYFLTNAYEHLKKQSMTGPSYTLTTQTASPYNATLDGTTAPTTLKDIQTLQFTPDEQYLIAVRGGNVATTFPYIYLVNPLNGDIVTAVELPSPLTGNYLLQQVAVIGNYIVTIGTNNLQVINFQPADEGTPINFVPPLFASRIVSTTRTICEFWHPKTLSKMDCAFHFRLSRDRS